MAHIFSSFRSSLPVRQIIILALAALATGSIYLITSFVKYRIGFPLDDSWIHLTYARNLAEYGLWSFQAGIPSAGSTAPFWSVLLAFGFWVGLGPYIWTYVLGILVLLGLGLVTETTTRKLLPSYKSNFPWVGMFFILEWHFSWAAMSGMETLLHGLIITAILSAIILKSRHYLTLGLFAGLSVWVRPDGLTLLGPLVVAVFFFEERASARIKGWLRLGIGFGSIFLFYLLFNLMVGGTPMPNTFYAKQAEYASWQQLPFLQRSGQLVLQLLVGPSLLLLPAIIFELVQSIKNRNWGILLSYIWAIGYMLLYVLRLPMYQHGRYIIPAMPILFLLGIRFILQFSQLKTFGRYQWFVNTLWASSVCMLSLLFIGLGANSYAQDVTLIEQEMVDTAQWAEANLPSGSVLAVHDIGALGYFGSHTIIDLAGLVSPEVIPFMRDEAQLAAYLDEKGVNYLIAFPDFYPELSKGREVVFVSSGTNFPETDFGRMTIYRWK